MENKKTHCVFITGGFLPNSFANGICVYNIAKEGLKQGINISVVAQKVPGNCRKERLENITIFRVPINFTARSYYKMLSNSRKKYVYRIYQLISIPIRKIRWRKYPFESKKLSKGIETALEEINSKEKIDYCIPVFGGIENILAAKEFKQNHPDCKLIYYFLDAILKQSCPRWISQEKAMYAQKQWVKYLFPFADQIIVMDPHLSKLSEVTDSMTFAKIKTLSIPLYIPTHHCLDKIVRKREHVSILFTGTLTKAMRNPEFFLRVYTMCADVRKELVFLGHGDCDDVIAAYAKRDNSIICSPPVSHDQVIRLQEQADILLNIGNSDNSMIPSKVFEYMSAQRAIISTYKNDDDPCLSYLRGYSPVCLLDERQDVESACEKLNVFLVDIQEGYWVNVNENELKRCMPKTFWNEIIE